MTACSKQRQTTHGLHNGAGLDGGGEAEHPGWYRPDVARHLPVFRQRRARQVAGGDLFAGPDPAVPQPCRAGILVPFILRAGVGSLFALERPWLQIAAAAPSRRWRSSSSTGRSRGLPLADTMTYYLAGPIYVTVLAALFLRSTVGWRRWTAVGVGFIGVVIALQPSAGVVRLASRSSRFAGSLLYSGFLVVTRTLRAHVRPQRWRHGRWSRPLGRRRGRGAVRNGCRSCTAPTTPCSACSASSALVGDRLRQPLAQAGAGLGRRSLPVHADRLGGALRLSRSSTTCRAGA